MFVTFEGIEGSGKSTQIKLLAQALEKQGYGVVLTREPGGTDISQQIRAILLDAKNHNMVPECEVLLYWAARAQHVQELILPCLKSGKIVLCDRYIDSTLAYQGFARKIDFKALKFLKEFTTKNLTIDKTFLFDLPAEQGLERAKNRINNLHESEKEDRFEREVLDFHKKVRQGFLDLAKEEKERFLLFDATNNIQDLHKDVLKQMLELLEKKS